MPPRSETSNGYNEQQHGGIQVLSGDGLMLNVPTEGLEVVEGIGDTEKQPFSTVSAVDEAPTGQDISQ
jgi:hypothetical protein